MGYRVETDHMGGSHGHVLSYMVGHMTDSGLVSHMTGHMMQQVIYPTVM